MQSCVFCQGTVEPASQRCQQCGRVQPEMRATAAAAPAQTLTTSCLHCGERLPAGARFCGRCGQALPRLSASITAAELTPDASKALDQEAISSTDKAQRVISTLSGQILVQDNNPPYLQGSVTSLFTDVFISYSRKDKAFVRQLFQALDEAKRRSWVDWEDIPPIVDWQEEIYSGIETASTFVFVLSPDSISSVPCQKEVEYALQYKKRIIPLLYRQVDPAAVNEELQKSNWISFEHREMFDFAFKQLLFALDTDLDYWHQSARLLTSAKEWEKKAKERSSTLRGKDLKAAERWRAEGATKIPPPGPPVTDFIAAGVKQRKRSRILAVSLLLVFLLTAGAAARFFLLLPPDPTRVTTTADDGTGSLRWAIANAPPGSTITFAPNVSGSIVLKKPLTFTRSLTVHGPGAEHLRITYPTAVAFGVAAWPATTVMISGMNFNNCIFNQGTLTLMNSTVSNSSVSCAGVAGGIYNYQGTLTLMNTIVADNTASGSNGNGGGGIVNYQGTLTLMNSTVADNTTSGGDANGGGIENNLGTLTLMNSTVSGNRADLSGGGIYNYHGTLALTNSTVSGNTSIVGGGIGNVSGTLTLTNSTVADNGPSGYGGGIEDTFIQSSSPASATNILFCTIYGNSAGQGGGIFSAELDQNNNLVTQQDSSVKVKIRNSIVAGNQGGNFLGTFTSDGYNLLQNEPGSTILDHQSADIVLPASAQLSRLIDSTLRNNPGPDGKPAPTQTLALLNTPGVTNPAVNAIPVADCVITITDPATKQSFRTDHDQRGVLRPQGPACDIGAYELTPT